MALPIILAAGRGIAAAWNWFRFANDVADAVEISKRVLQARLRQPSLRARASAR